MLLIMSLALFEFDSHQSPFHREVPRRYSAEDRSRDAWSKVRPLLESLRTQPVVPKYICIAGTFPY